VNSSSHMGNTVLLHSASVPWILRIILCYERMKPDVTPGIFLCKAGAALHNTQKRLFTS
jgi:hypothetical protein